ncbi:MAG: hypothetical protein AABY22_20185 [Nanoarchaeota archaeon]
MTDLKSIPCPNCGSTLIASLHAPQDGAHWTGGAPECSLEEFRAMDDFSCPNCDEIYIWDDLRERGLIK